MKKEYYSSLPKVLWLWIPLLFIAVQMVLELTLSGQTLSIMHSENGPHESLQAIIVAVAFVISVLTLWKMPKSNFWLVGWVGLAALCCFYVAGEEVSWGQHFMGWATPDFWSGVNDQNETNLHNTSSWFDQKPRLLLLVGSIVGGVLIPFLQRVKPALVPQKLAIIYPTAQFSLTAVIALSINFTDKAFEAMQDTPFFARGSEVEEVYLFYFVVVYLYMLYKRI